ncbi:phosphonate metabolism protein/1,5-bisphosphokinase (PRPP-forming) PhnN [Rhodopseudomonas palustris]|uniref:Ribose 1,5-bisphosphate phosphokinase PhnN n=1 Tax=Rhodopseudomonas palustris (strain BisB18) TaxID=316056 RepID=Q219U5_RHOPB
MSDLFTSAEQAAAPIGPGHFIAVVGPSGAGKDTLIALARAACSPEVLFPRRVVTRAASAYEDNDALTREAFDGALARGAFALNWDAHGLRYGLPASIDEAIRAGRSVVINVSRAVLPTIRKTYAHVTVVLITAPPEVLAARLAARKRPSDGSLAERLQRAVSVADVAADLTIVNVGPPEQHARELLEVIKRG